MLDYTALQYLTQAYLGVPYRWGGDDPSSGFDCSGLVCELLMSLGALPGGSDLTAEGLRSRFPPLPAGERPKMGDMVFWGQGGRATHVAMVVTGEGSILEAGGGGSSVLSRTDAEAKNAFVRIRPGSWRAMDRLGYARPTY